jgi:hypothetical protein
MEQRKIVFKERGRCQCLFIGDRGILKKPMFCLGMKKNTILESIEVTFHNDGVFKEKGDPFIGDEP